MKIVAINGSPRGKKGATWWVLEHFLKGSADAGTEVEAIQLAGKRIHHCTGEFACWFKTPGRCIHNDDMEEILPACLSADRLVFATPVYVDGMTGLLKNCIDRMIPGADPHFELRDGHCRHRWREARASKTVALVSVCGFPEVDNFDPLVAHMHAICRNMNADFGGAILRPAGPMLPEIPTIHPLFFRLRALRKTLEEAGRQFALTGKISEETAQAAAADIISREDYYKEVNTMLDKVLAKREGDKQES